MKVVVGVDGKSGSGSPAQAVSLLGRLRFPNAAVAVVHVRTPEPYGIWGVEPVLTAETYNAMEKTERDDAERWVRNVASQIRDGAPSLPEEDDPSPVRTFVLMEASVAGGLLSFAENDHADLIAIDGPQSSPWVEFLTGSVARALVTDSQPNNVLLAKDPQKYKKSPTPKEQAPRSMEGSSAGLRVVFATDHSPYANRCVRELLRLAPAGISHLTVMTAYPEDELSAVRGFLTDLAIHPETAVRQTLAAHNESVLRRLAPLLEANKATSESIVLGVPVNEAIRQTMTETNADLLIVGARGHGFLERLSLGSVAFDHAMTSPYSMLILRAKSEPNHG